jgi:hypothetical protein
MRGKMGKKYIVARCVREGNGGHLLPSLSSTEVFYFKEAKGDNLFEDVTLKGLAKKVAKGGIDLWADDISVTTIPAAIIYYSKKRTRVLHCPISDDNLVLFSDYYKSETKEAKT